MNRRYALGHVGPGQDSPGCRLVITDTYEITENFERFIRAVAVVSQKPVEQVLDTWFDDPDQRSVAEILADEFNIYEMASHIMYVLVAPVGEFEFADTAVEYAEQVFCWQDGTPDEAFEEFKLSANAAVALDGAGAREHFLKAAELAAW